MLKYSLPFFSAFLLTFGTYNRLKPFSPPAAPAPVIRSTEPPADLTLTDFSGPDLTPSPACLAVAPTGEVFVGVDMQGSLGKKPDMGSIIRLTDRDNDGKVDAPHGMRNIYDVAIDPYMNVFTRDNTNDGGGWNIRFSHQVQSGEYGYPVLFKHFTDKIIPVLVDVGGGSGIGALFMDEPTWPDQYNHLTIKQFNPSTQPIP